MSHLDNFPPDLNVSKRQQVSRIFQSQSTQLPVIYGSKSVEFIPFVRERDSMGRLLSKNYNQQVHNQDLVSVASSYFFRGDHPGPQNNHDAKINRAIKTFFKKIDLEQRQMRRTFSPKKVGVVFDKQFRVTHPNAEQEEAIDSFDLVKQKSHQFKLRNEAIHSSRSPKKQIEVAPNMKKIMSTPPDINFTKKASKNQQLIKRSKSTQNTKKNDENMPHKRNIIGGLSMRIKQNAEHPELKRYRQMNKLAIKVVPDYEEGHQKFFEKMKESKRIAHTIKKQLQLE